MPSPFKQSVQAQSAGEPQGGTAGDYRRALKSKRTSIFVREGRPHSLAHASVTQIAKMTL